MYCLCLCVCSTMGLALSGLDYMSANLSSLHLLLTDSCFRARNHSFNGTVSTRRAFAKASG
uniref:Secreted protein n=1 Tax=Phakopsora pachyrhizi TaxID=170000 RepID=A0A0S1MIP7_PHAPC